MHELAGSTCFTKLDGILPYLCIVLDYQSSLLMIFNTMGKLQICLPPWAIACAQDIFQWMMDQILTYCDGMIGITDNVVVHGKDEKEHDKCLLEFMRVTHEHGLVFNKDKCAVNRPPQCSSDVSTMPMEFILTLKRLVQSKRFQHLRQQLNYRSSLDW